MIGIIIIMYIKILTKVLLHKIHSLVVALDHFYC